jgi:hypothetical protein
MNYQAVIRDAGNTLVTNQTVGIQISILHGYPFGSIKYVETHAPMTNANGLVSLEIGSGSVIIGDIPGIDWSAGQHYLKTEVDPTGGTNYSIIDVTKLVSVPYALFASDDGDWIVSTDTVYTNDKWVGIGTSDPSAMLEVTGDALVNGLTIGKGNSNIESNMAVGSNALSTNTNGSSNQAIGLDALHNNESGSYNLAIGRKALYSTVNTSWNIAIGNNALYSHSIDCGFQIPEYSNIAIGFEAMRYSESPCGNVAIGNLAQNITESGFNTSLGHRTLLNNTSGSGNVAIGWESLKYNETGSNNCAIGLFVFASLNESSNNTAVGAYSNLVPSGSIIYNSTALGYYSEITASDQVRIGNSSVSSIGGFASWTTLPSDRRFKKSIEEDVVGLDFIKNLRPVTYLVDIDQFETYFERENEHENSWPSKYEKFEHRYTGFIAQEVEAAAKTVGFDFSGVDAPENEKDVYGLRYAEFVVPLVKAVQEQQVMIDELSIDLEAALDRLEALESEEN